MSEQPSTMGDVPVANPPGRVIAFKPRSKGGGDDDDRPVIEIVVGEIPRMVGQCIASLAAHDPNLFQRNGELVTITRQPARAEVIACAERVDSEHSCPRCRACAGEACAVDYRRGSNIVMRPGTPVVRPVGVPVLTERAAMAAEWMRWDAKAGEKIGKEKPTGEMVAAHPDRTVLGIVAARGDYPGINPLNNIIETPAFGSGGRIIGRPGYDRGTGMYLLPAFDMDSIPENPTQADAADALSFLWRELYSDFPFADVGPAAPDDVHRTAQYERARKVAGAFVGLASILTILARPAIHGACPGFIFEAATPGSGKSLQMHVTSMVTCGRAAGVMTFPMRGADPIEEEVEKILAGYALAGSRMIAFDNITGNLCGAALDKVLTAVDSIDLRKLGESPIITMPWTAVAMFSGNNMTMSPDVARRSMVSRIVSPLENPSGRPASDFRHPELLAWIKDNLPRLVRAAMIVLRAFWVSKEKPDCGIRGSFEAWSRIIPGAIKFAGGPNVIEAWAEDSSGASGGDEMSTAHGVLLNLWPFDMPCKASEIVAKVFANEFEIARGSAPDGYEDLREAIRTICKCPTAQIKASVLGASLAKLRDKIRDGLTLYRTMVRNVAVWTVKGRKPAPTAHVVAQQAPAAALPPAASVIVCEACRKPRGGAPGCCNPCVCGGCCDVDAGTWGACSCEPGAG